jgi:hypothetical protein
LLLVEAVQVEQLQQQAVEAEAVLYGAGFLQLLLMLLVQVVLLQYRLHQETQEEHLLIQG